MGVGVGEDPAVTVGPASIERGVPHAVRAMGRTKAVAMITIRRKLFAPGARKRLTERSLRLD